MRETRRMASNSGYVQVGRLHQQYEDKSKKQEHQRQLLLATVDKLTASEQNQRDLKNAQAARARAAEAKLRRRDKQIARSLDPDAKPGALSKLPLLQQKQMEGYIGDVEKSRATAVEAAREGGLLTLLGVRARGEPASVDL